MVRDATLVNIPVFQSPPEHTVERDPDSEFEGESFSLTPTFQIRC